MNPGRRAGLAPRVNLPLRRYQGQTARGGTNGTSRKIGEQAEGAEFAQRGAGNAASGDRPQRDAVELALRQS